MSNWLMHDIACICSSAMRQTSDPAGHLDTHCGWNGGYTKLVAVDVRLISGLWSHGDRQNACTNSGSLRVSLKKHCRIHVFGVTNLWLTLKLQRESSADNCIKYFLKNSFTDTFDWGQILWGENEYVAVTYACKWNISYTRCGRSQLLILLHIHCVSLKNPLAFLLYLSQMLLNDSENWNKYSPVKWL